MPSPSPEGVESEPSPSPEPLKSEPSPSPRAPSPSRVRVQLHCGTSLSMMFKGWLGGGGGELTAS